VPSTAKKRIKAREQARKGADKPQTQVPDDLRRARQIRPARLATSAYYHGQEVNQPGRKYTYS